MAMKKQKEAGFPTGMAVAGMVCSIITLAINLILIFACYLPLWCWGNSIVSGLNDYYW